MRSRGRLRAAFAGVAALSLVGGVAPAHAQAAPDPVVRTYLITEPDLVNNPAKVTEALKKDGNLDSLGIKPDPDNAARSIPRTAATEDPGYTVDSAEFDGGRKPENPYRYIDYGQCQANNSAPTELGWIKNRFSYCQRHLFVITYDDISTGLISTATIRSTIIGYGRIGPQPGSATTRYADFDFTAEVLEPNGIFFDPRSEMEIGIECAGEYRRDIDLDDDDACYANDDLESHEKSFVGWGLDPLAKYQLLSDGRRPDPRWGEQIAQGVFHFVYDFDFPGPNTPASKRTWEGGLRFDSADYLWDKQGSVFDRAVPGIGYSKSDPKIARHAKFVEESRANPGASWPAKPGKKLLGGSPLHADTFHRVARAKGHDVIIDQNRRVKDRACNAAGMPAPLPDEVAPYDCDEYGYATTYEGAAGWRDPGGIIDPNKYKDEFAVRWVNRDHNQEAGRRLNSFYETHRLLDVDRWNPQWNKELDPNDQERFWVPITP
ncbi:MAG: hypothetical protein QOF58_1694 [Pseudonocardiales bacterium]|nr:hypothetical protein [Pseudonocardiales bacterium]